MIPNMQAFFKGCLQSKQIVIMTKMWSIFLVAAFLHRLMIEKWCIKWIWLLTQGSFYIPFSVLCKSVELKVKHFKRIHQSLNCTTKIFFPMHVEKNHTYFLSSSSMTQLNNENSCLFLCGERSVGVNEPELRMSWWDEISGLLGNWATHMRITQLSFPLVDLSRLILQQHSAL